MRPAPRLQRAGAASRCRVCRNRFPQRGRTPTAAQSFRNFLRVCGRRRRCVTVPPMSSAKTLNWGILGAGSIAKAFAKGLVTSETGTLHAIGSRTQDKAETFGNEFNVPRRYGSYDALLKDADVDAVYIATPHPHHAEWAIKAAEAGK